MLRPDDVGGGADPEAIAVTVAVDATKVPEVPILAPTSLPTLAMDVLRRWLAYDALPSCTIPIAFVLVPSLSAFDGEFVPLLHSPATRLLSCGGIYVCSRGLGSAKLNAVSASLASWHHALMSPLLADKPTVTYSPVDQLLTWYPLGVSNSDTRQEEALKLRGSALDAAEVEAVLDRLHERHWRTPQAGGDIWEEASRGIPVEKAEAVFQQHVLIGCKAHFANHRAIPELTGSTGRCDLLLLPVEPPPAPQGKAIIEMKVVKSFGYAPRGSTPSPVSERANQKAVRKGFAQALMYARDNGCEVKVLCVCDMRNDDDDDIMTHYNAFASKHSIVGLRYFMYRSADSLREAEVPDLPALPPAQGRTRGPSR